MNRIIRLTLIACLVFSFGLAAAAQTSTTVAGYTLEFVGVQYDWDAPSSTWTYRLTWNGTPPSLSHFTIDLCETAVVTGYSPTDLPVVFSDGSVTDPSNNVIKWDNVPDGYLTPGVPRLFSFTLDNTYAVTSGVTFWAKAGSQQDNAGNPGPIDGPAIDCTIADPELTVTKSCTPDVFVGDTIDYTITVTNTGNVTLSNVVVSDPLAGISKNIGTLAPGASNSEPITASVDATEAGTITNMVTANGSYYGNVVGDTDSCSTTVWELSVSKTADTSYTRDWDWTLEKTVEEESLDVCDSAPETLHYTITASRSNTDSDHTVSGTITVTNPAPIAATLSEVADDFDGLAIVPNCPSLVVPAEGSLDCTYSLGLARAIDGVNTATATLDNGTSFSGSANVTFGDPTTELDASVTIGDTLTCPEGFLCSETSNSWTLAGDASIPWDVAIGKNGALCNSYFDVVNTVSLVESDGSHSSSVTTGIYTCPCPFGCTLTIGYWKTHAGFHGRNADVVTQYLPISLGSGGGKTVVVTTATEAVNVLSFGLGSASNGITKLYAQLLAAKLNIANGSSPSEISSEIAQADAFLAKYNHEDWNSLKQGDKKKVLSWMSTFDGYNNGDIGPGHCD